MIINLMEKDVEQELVNRIKKIDGLTYKFVSPNVSGVPDRIVIYDGKVVFVELKKEGGRLSALQKLTLKKLRECKAQSTVIYTKKGVDDFIDDLTNHYIISRSYI